MPIGSDSARGQRTFLLDASAKSGILDLCLCKILLHPRTRRQLHELHSKSPLKLFLCHAENGVKMACSLAENYGLWLRVTQLAGARDGIHTLFVDIFASQRTPFVFCEKRKSDEIVGLLQVCLNCSSIYMNSYRVH